MKHLEDAIALACTYHRGQRDKGGQPYILHCLRVMMAVKGEHTQMVAVLHDIIEDTQVTATDLRGWGYPNCVVDGVVALTRLPNVRYMDYIQYVAKNPGLVVVKIADLEDNMNRSRIPHWTPRDEKRWLKYQTALAYLKADPTTRSMLFPK